MGEIVSLTANRARLDIFPAGGGSVVRFAWLSKEGAWVDLMRPAPADIIHRYDPVRTSCFPLVPYCDVVTNGSFEFEGVRHVLPPNYAEIADPMHGEGWISPWTVDSVTENTLLLRFAHAAGSPGFPFSYHATLLFELFGGELAMGIALTNQDPRPMPAGIGVHPYYVRTRDLLVSTDARRVWPANAARERTAAVAVPPAWDFGSLRSIGDVCLDHSFADWSGRYDLIWLSHATRLTVTAEPVFRNLQIFAPLHADYFCMEPISNAMDAFNLASLGIEGHNMLVLQPGQTLSGRVVFRPSDLT
jgi:aldose 1-epimerase